MQNGQKSIRCDIYKYDMDIVCFFTAVFSHLIVPQCLLECKSRTCLVQSLPPKVYSFMLSPQRKAYRQQLKK